MPYALGTRDQWMQREVFETLHHAVSNATGVILYVYGARGKLLMAMDVREIIQQHLGTYIHASDWDYFADEALAALLVNAESVPLGPLVKQLKKLLRDIGR